MREPVSGDDEEVTFPDPREEDIMAGDRRLSRPDASLPDWEVPDTSYRPIPIVWFTSALIVQTVSLTAALFLFAFSPPLVTALAGLLTGAVGAWTWRRGMSGASLAWRAATIIMLGALLALVLLAVSVI